MSTLVQKSKVEKAIRALPEALRRKVLAIYNSRCAWRHGSPQHAKKHPASAVSPEQYVLMALCHYRCGMPFRPMEMAFRLHPASGNDAQRCAMRGNRILRKSGAPAWFKAIKAESKAKAVKAVAKAKPKAKAAKKAAVKKELVAA